MSQLITLEGDTTEIGNLQVLEISGDFLDQKEIGNFVEGDFYPEKILVAPINSLNGENAYWIDLNGDQSELGFAMFARAFSKFGKIGNIGKGMKIPKVKIPKVKMPKVKMPKLKIKMPKVKMPKLPKIKMPKLPKIKMPKLPDMPQDEEEDQTEEDQTEEDQTEEDQTEEDQTEEGQTEEGQTEEGQTEEDQTEESQTEENQEMNEDLNGNIYNRVNNEMGFLPMLMAAAPMAVDMAQKSQQANAQKKAQRSAKNNNLLKSFLSKTQPAQKPQRVIKTVKSNPIKKPVALKLSSTGKMGLTAPTQTPKTRDFFEKEKPFYETTPGLLVIGGGAIAIFYLMNQKGKRR